MAPKGKPENLIPIASRTSEELRAITTKGGIASGVARAEKKRISQMYAEFLADEFDVELDGNKEKLSGPELIRRVTKAILARADSSSVQMLKEIREATEGNKLELSGADGGPMTFQYVEPLKKDASPEGI